METARSEHFTRRLRKHLYDCLGEAVTEQNLHESMWPGATP
jgi:hypothetical protein